MNIRQRFDNALVFEMCYRDLCIYSEKSKFLFIRSSVLHNANDINLYIVDGFVVFYEPRRALHNKIVPFIKHSFSMWSLKCMHA